MICVPVTPRQLLWINWRNLHEIFWERVERLAVASSTCPAHSGLPNPSGKEAVSLPSRFHRGEAGRGAGQRSPFDHTKIFQPQHYWLFGPVNSSCCGRCAAHCKMSSCIPELLLHVSHSPSDVIIKNDSVLVVKISKGCLIYIVVI